MTIHGAISRRKGAALMAFPMAAAVFIMVGNTANAAIVATVPLASSANYSVLGHSTVTNTGPSILGESLGLSPGTSVTGFPPGLVLPPGTQDITNAVALQAQSDLTAAYGDAHGRPLAGPPLLGTPIVTDVGNLTLGAGVYAGPNRSALQLTGPLVLDGAGDASSVFIFQTDSTLTTASSSTVRLINGAQECNVFWQVGSSATLGTGSVFTGNILALASITVTTNVLVHGRALASTGAVTLDSDVFTKPTCATGGSGSTTTTTASSGTTTTTASSGTTPTTAARGTATTIALPKTPIALTSGGPGVPGVSGPPRTGGGPLRTAEFPWLAVLLAALLGGAGTMGAVMSGRLHGHDAAQSGR